MFENVVRWFKTFFCDVPLPLRNAHTSDAKNVFGFFANFKRMFEFAEDCLKLVHSEQAVCSRMKSAAIVGV